MTTATDPKTVGAPATGITLRPYQRQAIRAILDAYRRGVKRQLLTLATGLGKTVIVSALASFSQWGPRHRMLGIMHRDELIQQAVERLQEQNPDRSIGIEKARSRAGNADISLASIQTIGRKDSPRLLQMDPAQYSKIWIDEVHHAPAASYKRVLGHFNLVGDCRADRLLLGTTATPERLDRLGYDDIFDDVVYRYGLREGIQDGWLADLACYRVMTGTDLSGVRSRAGDFVTKDLAASVDSNARNQLCLDAFMAHAHDMPNLVFCVTKQHARNVTAIFTRAGVTAACIVEDTPPAVRRETLQGFASGDVQVLVNVSVLTEGFDAPQVAAVHLLRPTRSSALLMQMIGRGTRTSPGKDCCLVFDYADDIPDGRLATLGAIFGLPPQFDFRGNRVLEQLQQIDQVEDEVEGLSIQDCSSLEDFFHRLERIDLLSCYSAAPKEIAANTCFRWHRHGETYRLQWINESVASLRRNATAPWAQRQLEVITELGLSGAREHLDISVNQLGAWEIVSTTRGSKAASRRLYVTKSLSTAVKKAEGWVRSNRPHVVRLLDRTAAWNYQPATEAQVATLRRKGYDLQQLAGVSKGQASSLMARRPPFLLRSSSPSAEKHTHA